MKIKVKLFGTLAQDFPKADFQKGVGMKIPDGAIVKDLLNHLDIQESRGYLVIIGNTKAGPMDRLIHGSTIKIFQAMAGG